MRSRESTMVSAFENGHRCTTHCVRNASIRSSESTMVSAFEKPCPSPVVHVVLDGRAGRPHRVDEQLRLRGRHHLVVGALQHEHGHGDLVRVRDR